MGNGKGQARELTAEGKQLFAESSPLRQFLLGQGMEAARTGGTPGSKVPIIQRAVEAQKQATSQSLRGAQDQLAGAGLADSPFAQGITSDIRSRGDMSASTVAAQINENLVGGASNMALGLPAISGSNIGNAGQLMNSAKAGSKGSCWVADVLFGEWDHRTLAARRWVGTHPHHPFVRLYSRYGQKWAEYLRPRPLAQLLVRPIWLTMAHYGAET